MYVLEFRHQKIMPSFTVLRQIFRPCESFFPSKIRKAHYYSTNVLINKLLVYYVNFNRVIYSLLLSYY